MFRTVVAAALVIGAAWLLADDNPATQPSQRIAHAEQSQEAQARAKLLHELTHGALQVMHRDFFDDENSHSIPSASLDDVFREMEKDFDVQMKWLTVNTDIVNADHQAATDFEKRAVQQLNAGHPFVEEVAATRYHFAGAIRLGSQCLKCHVARRTSNVERLAALVISMPLVAPATE